MPHEKRDTSKEEIIRDSSIGRLDFASFNSR